MRVLFRFDGALQCSEFNNISFSDNLYNSKDNIKTGLIGTEAAGLFAFEMTEKEAEDYLNNEILRNGYVDLSKYTAVYVDTMFEEGNSTNESDIDS